MYSRQTLLAVGGGALVAGYYLGRWRSQGRLRALLRDNWAILSPRDITLVGCLVNRGHRHLFSSWPRLGANDDIKRKLLVRANALVDEVATALEDERLAVLQPPVAEPCPVKLEHHGDVREDSYYWLRDDSRSDPKVVAHLTAETAYTKAVLADTEQLQEDLYKEMRGRIQEADQSAPQRYDGYFYYSRTLAGAQYRVHCRRKLPPSAGPPTESEEVDEGQPEEVLLDENAEAAKHSFYMVGGFEMSPNHRLLAYAEDTTGNEMYTLYVKDVAAGKQLLAQPIQETAGQVAWASDNATLFYVTKDKLDRPHKVWRRTLGGDAAAAQDVLVFHEPDDAFHVSIDRARSEHMLLIHTGSAVTSDVRFLDASDPGGEWRLLAAREDDVEYSASHRGDHFFITVRDRRRQNSELLVAPVADPSNTTVLLEHREDIKLESVVVSRDYLVAFEREKGLQVATVYKLPGNSVQPTSLGEGKRVDFDEPAYELGPGAQGDFDSPVLRLTYSSLTTPTSVIDYNMATHARAVRKVQAVLGGFSKEDYHTERLWATAADGKEVPISLVFRKDLVKLDGSDPLLLDGYGSYEICNDPYFSSNRLSLLDRGFIFAIAHVRGGGEMGRYWYEDGKYLNKKNTFTDFIACAEHLIKLKWTSPEKICIQGRSAGGLTMGAVVNMRPDLFNAVIMGVPFVDCLTTMLDPDIPLTVIEWEEWGNPNDKEYYEYMKSYSPVDNIKAQDYPNILITGGLHDPRVGYWEPSKFCAKLRATKTDNNLLLFKCEMGAGHFSQSGRFDKLKEVALEFAFLLKCQNRTKYQPAHPISS